MILVQLLSHPALILEGFSLLLRLHFLLFEVVSSEAKPLLLPGAGLDCIIHKEPVHQGIGKLL